MLKILSCVRVDCASATCRKITPSLPKKQKIRPFLPICAAVAAHAKAQQPEACVTSGCWACVEGLAWHVARLVGGLCVRACR